MRTRYAGLLNTLLYLLLFFALLWLAQTYLNNYYLRILMIIGIYIMLTVSLNLTNGFTGDFSLGHAAFMAVGAYTSAILTLPAATKMSMNTGLTCLVAGTDRPLSDCDAHGRHAGLPAGVCRRHPCVALARPLSRRRHHGTHGHRAHRRQ